MKCLAHSSCLYQAEQGGWEVLENTKAVGVNPDCDGVIGSGTSSRDSQLSAQATCFFPCQKSSTNVPSRPPKDLARLSMAHNLCCFY